MKQINSNEEAASNHSIKSNSRWMLRLIMYVLVCLFAILILFVISQWTVPAIFNFITIVISCILSTIPFFFPVEILVDQCLYLIDQNAHRYKLYFKSYKYDILIVYCSSNYLWARWIQAYLKYKEGYKVEMVSWNGDGEDYEQKMRLLKMKTQGIVTIVSPRFIELLMSSRNNTTSSRDFGAFARLHHYNRFRNICFVVKELHEVLPSYISRQNLYLEKKNQEQVSSEVKEVCLRISPTGEKNDQERLPYFPGKLDGWSMPEKAKEIGDEFVGRRKIIDELYRKFHNDGSDAFVKKQTLYGLAGVGKTGVAVRYIQEYGDEYQYILWLSSDKILENLQEIIKNIRKLNDAENALSKEEEEEIRLLTNSATIEQLSAFMVKWLESRSKWLLVLDEVDFIPFANRSQYIPRRSASQGHVLLIAVQRSRREGTALEVAGMGEDEGAELLLKEAGMYNIFDDANVYEAKEKVAKDISKLLGGHPEAIIYAGRDLSHGRESLYEYRRIFEGNPDEVFEQWDTKYRSQSSHPNYLFTWLSAYEAMQKDHDSEKIVAAKVLQICSFFSSGEIPLRLVGISVEAMRSYINNWSERSTSNIIGHLNDYGFIKRDGSTIYINPLVQAVVRNKLSLDERKDWLEQAIRAINVVLMRKVLSMENGFDWHSCQQSLRLGHKTWEKYEPYIAHINACVGYWKVYNGVDSISIVRLLYIMGCYYKYRAQYHEAVKFLKKALSVSEKLLLPKVSTSPAESPDEATCRDTLAEVYGMVGYYLDALKNCRQALSDRESTSALMHGGPDRQKLDCDVAQSLSTLGELLRLVGQYQEARKCHLRALKIRKRQHCSDEMNIAESENHLGRLYHDWIYPKDARVWAYPQQDIILDVDRWPYFQMAELYYIKALTKREAFSSHNMARGSHPDVAQTKSNLAELYLHDGKYMDALYFSRYAVAISRNALGGDHLESIQLSANKETFATEIVEAGKQGKLNLQREIAAKNIIPDEDYIYNDDSKNLNRRTIVFEAIYPQDLRQCLKAFTIESDSEPKQHIVIAEKHYRMAELGLYLTSNERGRETVNSSMKPLDYFEDALATWPHELDDSGYFHIKKLRILVRYTDILTQYKGKTLLINGKTFDVNGKIEDQQIEIKKILVQYEVKNKRNRNTVLSP